MDIIETATTTVNGTTTILQRDTFYPSSSAEYQLYAGSAALVWLTFYILAAATFFAIVYFFYKRFNR